jgi:hypothetical protein
MSQEQQGTSLHKFIDDNAVGIAKFLSRISGFTEDLSSSYQALHNAHEALKAEVAELKAKSAEKAE